jgi:hypothetical protein
MVMKIKMNGHEISKEQIISLTAWDKEVKGYAGVVEYKNNNGHYMPYVTKSEITAIKAMGIIPDNIPAISYSGTY